jgi:transcriptional regulator CtsR
MARLSDTIEMFIKELLRDTEQDEILIQRNNLASQFSCAPSQINYVLTTRFTYDKGYYIESRRGGGGCIVIKKVQYNTNDDRLESLFQAIGESITYDRAKSIIDQITDMDIITKRENLIMKIAINDKYLRISQDGNRTRADMLKNFMVIIFE